MLQLAPSFERFRHRDFVGIFNIAAGGNTCSDARHPDRIIFQHSLNVDRCGLAFQSWIGRNNQLVHFSPFNALTQGREPQMFRSDAVQWRQRSVEHVIDAVIAARFLDRGNVGWFFDNANQALIARGAAAIYAGINVGNIAANRAKMKTGLDLTNRLGKQVGVFVAGA